MVTASPVIDRLCIRWEKVPVNEFANLEEAKMVIQIDAEVNDTLEHCTTVARRLAKDWSINVTFYYDRVGYFVTPDGVISVENVTRTTKK